jgi:2,4-dienoyl-CoA reductase-like NADH-dependent reductase (Old Yellow Enzyme family)
MEKLGSSILFTEKIIGSLTIKNRFVRSATFESAANDDGTIGEEYAKIYNRLSRGNVGLIITGMISVSEEGKSYQRQAGLFSDSGIDGFAAMNDEIRRNGSRIFAQICYGGRQSLMHGKFPKAASLGVPDFIYQVLPRCMNGKEISSAIKAFSEAASRAQKSGFDGIQIHAAHGYLISNFLSPFSNRRTDEWGGDRKRRFLFLKRVYESIRESVGSGFPVTAKINISDHTPWGGISLEESAKQIERLVQMGIDAIEISCGTMAFSMFNQSRGKVPARELSKTMPVPLQPFASLLLKTVYPESKYAFEEGYNLWATQKVKSVKRDTPLIVVGGLRTFDFIEKIVQDGKADFVALCRPLIAEPLLIKRWSEGNMKQLICSNCNKCFAGLAMHEPLKCNLNTRF